MDGGVLAPQTDFFCPLPSRVVLDIGEGQLSWTFGGGRGGLRLTFFGREGGGDQLFLVGGREGFKSDGVHNRYLRSFLRQASGQSDSLRHCNSTPGSDITTQSTNQSGVNGKLNSRMQKANHRRPPPPTSGMDPHEVHLPDEHVGPPASRHIRGCTFQNVSPSAQNPRSCACLAVMGMSQVDGHTGRNAWLGEGAFADDAKG